MTLQNEKFEELVSRQLTAELEPQRGKALAAFRAHLAAPAPMPISQGRSRRTLALWAGVPSLMAACVAVVVTLHFAGPGNPTTGIVKPGVVEPLPASDRVAKVEVKPQAPKSTGTIVFDGVVTHDTAGNIVMNGENMPLREVNHLEVRQRRIFDPSDSSTTTITEPVEKVGYVQVQPY